MFLSYFKPFIMKILIKIFSLLLSVGLFLFMAILGMIPIKAEGYNPVKPDIDTRYTYYYSEEKFDNIKTGETQKDVLRKLDEPFSRDTIGNYVHWRYTSDGGCSWNDFAWLGRIVVFDKDGVVVKKIKTVYYD